MRDLVAAARLTAVAAATSSLYVLLAAALPFVRLGAGSPARLKSRMCRFWARLVSALLGMRIETAGVPPAGAFLLVANHLSYVDVLVLASRLECVFVAKDEVERWPVVGRLCRAVDTLFISRERRGDVARVVVRIEELLKEGRGVVLFPEGTSTDGSLVLPFRPALLETAVRAGVPVSYASLTYVTQPGVPPAQSSVCWWGEAGFLDHLIDLLRLPGFEARVTFGAERIFDTDRKVLAERLWRAVRRQFVPVTS
jgi:1-acyl-sn-glycerol-3-phosphate acyltransferase